MSRGRHPTVDIAMFPAEVLFAYLVAVLVVVIAPGPDNILAIGRGLSQGPAAAALSSAAAGIGIMLHTIAATLGLALVLQTSWLVKVIGAAYLLWLGYKALRSRSLISFSPAARQPLLKVFITGLLSNVLNPKPGLFVVAFIPQFVSAARGPVYAQMLVLGAIFAHDHGQSLFGLAQRHGVIACLIEQVCGFAKRAQLC